MKYRIDMRPHIAMQHPVYRVAELQDDECDKWGLHLVLYIAVVLFLW